MNKVSLIVEKHRLLQDDAIENQEKEKRDTIHKGFRTLAKEQEKKEQILVKNKSLDRIRVLDKQRLNRSSLKRDD